MKTCFKCGETKPLDEFYKHPMMADGRLNKCKECARRDVTENRKSKLGYYRAYDRKRSTDPEREAANRRRSKTDPGRAIHAESLKRWFKRNPEKRHAHSAVNAALRSGRLERKPCEQCGAKAEAHHDDYSKPLDVRWLCSGHHADHHKAEREAQRSA